MTPQTHVHANFGETSQFISTILNFAGSNTDAKSISGKSMAVQTPNLVKTYETVAELLHSAKS